MKLNVREVRSVAIVDLDGNITIGRGDVQLRQLVSELLASGRSRILLNLANVAYMDSAGIGEMVACSKLAGERKATIRLLSPTTKVREMLHITRFEDLFEIFDDEREALDSFATSRQSR